MPAPAGLRATGNPFHRRPARSPAPRRVYVTEQIGSITIPRSGIAVSGSNFEVLIGFEVTPQMAAFNREGKRFRVNVGQTASAAPNP